MWLNEREQLTMKKIDHVFATTSWEDLHSACFLSALGTAVSDHYPLLLDLNADFCSGKRFRFEALWTKAIWFLE